MPASVKPNEPSMASTRSPISKCWCGPTTSAVGEEGERDARRRDLRQRDAEEDHAPQHEVDADQRADQPDQDAADQRVAQQEARAEDLEERAHPPAPIAPSISAIRSGASISSAGPRTARPPCTQTTTPASGRSMRS